MAKTTSKAKHDEEILRDVAPRLFKDPDKAEAWVDSAMSKLGHKRITSWEDHQEEIPEGEPEDEDSGLEIEEEEEEEEAPPAKPTGKSYWKK